MELRGARVFNFFGVTGDVETGVEASNQVVVPHYQRPFKWEASHVEQLVSDWSENREKYFAGSIVTVVPDGKSVHSLVDGQQRFTTIYLANYLRFLLLRVSLRQAIALKVSTRLEGLIKELSTAYKYVFLTSDSEDATLMYLGTILSDFEEAQELSGDASETAFSLILEKYKCNLAFPDALESDDSYLELHAKSLSSFVRGREPLLNYDRKAFNVTLSSVLSSVVITMSDQEKPILFSPDGVPDNQKVYFEAIEAIFNSFVGLADRSVGDGTVSTLKYCSHVIEYIFDFLDNISLCVIQTKKTEDAYTLFEVMNDRALSLDDLDLIKNQFYKIFCTKNEGLGDDKIDEIIEVRELQWGDKIFNSNSVSVAKDKMTSYFAAAYITGDDALDYKSTKDYKSSIYEYLKNSSSYSKIDFERDFNIYEFCSVFIRKFGVAINSRHIPCLKAEYDINSSMVSRLVHLLMALNYEGVLSGFVNLCIKYFETKISGTCDPQKADIFIASLLDPASTEHSDLLSQAKRLWQNVLLSSDYRAPRAESIELVRRNNRSSSGSCYFQNPAVTVDAKNSFRGYCNEWRYGSNDLKMRVLFARVIRSSFDTVSNKLQHNDFFTTIDSDGASKLHLDHMEPTAPNPSCPEKYFSSSERDFHVNGLGNMFPLPGSENISKSNKPMVDAFTYLSTAGLSSHWLVKDTKDIFDSNNVNDVPVANFFTARKDKLISYFEQVIEIG